MRVVPKISVTSYDVLKTIDSASGSDSHEKANIFRSRHSANEEYSPNPNFYKKSLPISMHKDKESTDEHSFINENFNLEIVVTPDKDFCDQFYRDVNRISQERLDGFQQTVSNPNLETQNLPISNLEHFKNESDANSGSEKMIKGDNTFHNLSQNSPSLFGGVTYITGPNDTKNIQYIIESKFCSKLMGKIDEVNDSYEKEGDTLENSKTVLNPSLSNLQSEGIRVSSLDGKIILNSSNHQISNGEIIGNSVVKIEDNAGVFVGQGGSDKEINLFNNDQSDGEETGGKFLIACNKQDLGKPPASDCLDDKNPMSFGDSSKVNTNFGQSNQTDPEKSRRKLSEVNHNNYNESSVNQSGTQIYDSEKMILEEFNRDIGPGIPQDEDQSSGASDDNETSQILLVSRDKTLLSSKATSILPKDKPLTSMVILNKNCQEEDFKNIGGHTADD